MPTEGSEARALIAPFLRRRNTRCKKPRVVTREHRRRKAEAARYIADPDFN